MTYILIFLGYPLYLLILALVRELLVSTRFLITYNMVMLFVSMLIWGSVMIGIMGTFTNNSMLMTLAVMDVIASMSVYKYYLTQSDKVEDWEYSAFLSFGILFSISGPLVVYGSGVTSAVPVTVLSVSQPTGSYGSKTTLIVKDSKGKRHIVTSYDATTLQPNDKTKVDIIPKGWVLPE